MSIFFPIHLEYGVRYIFSYIYTSLPYLVLALYYLKQLKAGEKELKKSEIQI